MFLCTLLKFQPQIFRFATNEVLKELAVDRANAFARAEHSKDSFESCLHRKIAEMKDLKCQVAIQDIMYLMIINNFSEIKAPLLPNLSNHPKNSRPQPFPSKEAELESIHRPEILEMVREHISTILKWINPPEFAAFSSHNSSTIEITNLHFSRLYAASILYGYFLRSISLRHRLELLLACVSFIPGEDFTKFSICLDSKRLRGYILGLDSKSLQLCAKVRSNEAVGLIERRRLSLFTAEEKSGGGPAASEREGTVRVAITSVKRILLEAVAFGSFLWDAEEEVVSVFRI